MRRSRFAAERRRRPGAAGLRLLATLALLTGMLAALPSATALAAFDTTAQFISAPGPTTDIACPSSTTCYVTSYIGGVLDNGGETGTLTELTIGSNGSVTSGAPVPPGLATVTPTDAHIDKGQLHGIDCVSADICYTVGKVWVEHTISGTDNDLRVLGSVNPFVRDADGTVTGWDIHWIDSTDNLEDIACPSPTMCFAVGSLADEGRTVAVHVNGDASGNDSTPGDWNTVAGFVHLNSIACPTTATCYAVGSDSNRDGVYVTLSTAAMDSANGAPIATAQAIDGTHQLLGITCPTTSVCYAAGEGDSGGVQVSFAVNGSSMTPTFIQTVPGTTTFNGVACADATDCFAVGNVATGADTTNAVVYQFSVSGSSVQQVLAIGDLSAVDCAGGACYAAGTNAFTGQSVVVTINPRALIPTSVSVSATANPTTYGDAATLVATVTPASGTTLPGGTVQFAIDGTPVGSPVPITFANFQTQASVTVPSLPAGGHSVTATYSGDATYAASTSAGFTQTVNKAPLTITADDKSMTAGDAIPPLTYTPSGFVAGDNAGALSGAPSLSTTATPASAPGDYPISVGAGTLTSANYSFVFVNGVLSVSAANRAPTARAGADQTVVEGATVTLDGSGSSDLDGNSLTYAWQLVDHTGPAPSLSSTTDARPSFATTDNGTATFRLTVSDGKGGVDSDEVVITVSNAAPTAVFSAPAAVDEGSPIALSFADEADASTADTQAGFSYAFDCGSGYGAFGASSAATCPTSDNGERTVRGQVRDKDGGVSEYTSQVTINNIAPTGTLNAPAAVNEGGAIALSLSAPSDPSTSDAAAGFSYAFDCGSGFGPFGTSGAASCATSDSGTRKVAARIRDKDGGVSEYSQLVTIANVAPGATFTAPATADEGGSIALALTDPSDPSAADVQAGFSFAFDCGAGYGAFGSASTATCAAGDDGALAVSGRIRDKDGGVSEYSANVSVTNVAPSIAAIAAPLDPAAVNTTVATSATFTDPGALDTHSATWAWGDGTSSAATISESGGAGTASGQHAYATPGVYTLTLTLIDDDGGSTSATYQYVVVYDPSGGFVTGGGWIDSPVGACQLTPDCASATGKAKIGFQAKYTQGATVPTGNTEFKFQAAGLDFTSTSYDWLVVAGSKAKFKGHGTINGAGDYGFMLSATDGQSKGSGGVDTFRIKIWDAVTGAVVYDNQLGASDDADPTTAMGGGSIVVHK